MNLEHARLKAQQETGNSQTRSSQCAFNDGWNTAMEIMFKQHTELQKSFSLIPGGIFYGAQPEYHDAVNNFRSLLLNLPVN